MDTKDKNTDSASSFMSPDPGVGPRGAEMLSVPGALDAQTATQDGVELDNRLPLPADVRTVPPVEKTSTPLQDSLRRLRRDKRAMISLGIIVLFVIIPLIGPVIYTHIGGQVTNGLTGQPVGPDQYHSPFVQFLDHQDELPSARNWLGTDRIGRDILARLMQGMLISLFVAIAVEVVDISLGTFVGVCAGFFGGWIDQLLARFTDIMFAFPGLLFVILISGIFGPSLDDPLSKIPVIGANGNARLLIVSIALAFVSWPLMARFVRGQTLQLKEQQFIEAARTSGTTNSRIITRHIVPNLFNIVVVAATLNITNTVIAEAGLSFLGLGVSIPGSSIGLMINDATDVIDVHPWEILVPAVTLTIIVLAFSFLGDGLRDAFDPRAKD
jgi:peptide/nickel transport system permease protein